MSDLLAGVYRHCRICAVEKPSTEFSKQASKRDGLMPYCKPCNRAKVAAWKAQNPERVKAAQQRNRARATERERSRKLRGYGLTQESYDALLTKQSGCCAGCFEQFVGTPYIDHDHATGRVRGLLCNGCNKSIGFAKDDPTRLRALALYLEAS